MNATNCSATDQRINTPGLSANASSDTLHFTCLCGSYGFQTVYAIADFDNSLAETSENNNAAGITFFCGSILPGYSPQCFDYV
jgi:hypothetical protein